MKRLQTYFSILTGIFALAGALAMLIAVAFVGFEHLGLLIWLMFAGTTFAFIVSLIIGHYMADPLASLHKNAKALLDGDASVVIAPDGKLYESDLLAQDFSALSEQTKTKMSDLAVQQKRQTQFISDVAHELRTPLTAIRGNAETLMDPDMPQALRERFCHTIISESERLSHMANELLTLQHIEEGTNPVMMQRVNLHAIAEDVADALSPLVEERDGTIEIVGEAPDVLGVRERLQQVIYNLVANACRFIGKGGHVTIKLEGLAEQSIVSVLDDGPGFGNVDPKLLFTRFYRGDNSRARNTGGTGLGLAIAKSIVDAHDGTIEAFNRAEGGACFIVALPSIHEHVM